MKIEKIPHPLIEKWAQKHYELETAINVAVAKMPDDHLKALKHAANSLTATNCWFAEFDVKEMVEGSISREEHARKGKQQSAAGEGSKESK